MCFVRSSSNVLQADQTAPSPPPPIPSYSLSSFYSHLISLFPLLPRDPLSIQRSKPLLRSRRRGSLMERPSGPSRARLPRPHAGAHHALITPFIPDPIPVLISILVNSLSRYLVISLTNRRGPMSEPGRATVRPIGRAEYTVRSCQLKRNAFQSNIIESILEMHR